MDVFSEEILKVKENEARIKTIVEKILPELDEKIASLEVAEIRAAHGTTFHITQDLKESRQLRDNFKSEKSQKQEEVKKIKKDIENLDLEDSQNSSKKSEDSQNSSKKSEDSQNSSKKSEDSQDFSKKSEDSQDFSKKSEDSQDFSKKSEEKKRSTESEQKHIRESYSQYHRFNLDQHDFEKRRNDYTKESVDSSTTEAIQIESLLTDLDEVNRSIKITLLYVATFFEQLSVKDFEKVVAFVLKQQIVRVPVKVRDEKGEEKIVMEDKELFQIWNMDFQKQSSLLKECHLKALRLKDSRKIIDFSVPYLRQNAKEVFEEDYASYLEAQFKRVRFLLLDTSNEIVFNVINISSEMAVSDPGSHGCSWLILLYELLRSSELILKNFASISSEEDKQQYLNYLENKLDSAQKEDIVLFNNLLNLPDWEETKKFVFWKLSALVARMCQYSELQDEVKRFLHWAINEQDYQYNQGYENAVLEIIKPLDSVPNFDQIEWIRQLLDRSSQEVGLKTYIFLGFMLQKSGDNIHKFLRGIKSWLPKSDISYEKFSISNIYALQFIFDYSFEILSNLKLEDFGCYPSKYNLFIFAESDSIDSNLKMLVEWIFYPSLKRILNRGFTIEHLAGNILMDWFNILWGFGKEPHTEAKETTKRILKQVVAATNSKQQKMLINYWNEKGEELLEQADQLSNEAEDDDEAEEERKLCMQKYKNLKHLKNQFKELQKVEV